jgi:hypothetical protein
LEKEVLNSLRDFILTPENLSILQAHLDSSLTNLQADLNCQKAELTARLGSVRRRISNLVSVIAEAPSRALVEKLKALEVEEAELLSGLDGLDRQAAAPARRYTLEEIRVTAADLTSRLATVDPVVIRSILAGLIDRIVVDREGRSLSGMINYYYPPDPGPAPPASLSLLPVGAHRLRRSFSFTGTIPPPGRPVG